MISFSISITGITKLLILNIVKTQLNNRVNKINRQIFQSVINLELGNLKRS